MPNTHKHLGFPSGSLVKNLPMQETLLINNVVLVSGAQQTASVIHTYVSIHFEVLFPFRLLQNIE